MKNKIIITLIFIFLASNLFSKEVDLNSARSIAMNFSREFYSFDNMNISSIDTKKYNDMLLMYVFNFDPNGFVIIAADDRLLPVIGYSINNSINLNSLPIQLDYIINSYSDNIIDVLNNNYDTDEYIESLWTKLLNNEFIRDAHHREIDPMITANWNQGGEWNDLCPNNSVVGCVAVAMGQVMYYWGYPDVGYGYSQYFDHDHGIISVNFSDYNYNFFDMEDDYATESSQLLLYHAGVAVQMDYSPWSSGASVCWEGPSAQAALDDNFLYNDDITCETKINYSEEDWNSKIKDQLDRGWPVVYRGYSEDAGHAWNIDGYQDNYFHCNWGWGGSANGYFYFDNLNGGGYNFIENQAALLNIIPENINSPVALFEFVIDDLTVEFLDLSDLINEDIITDWYWNFGDNQISEIQYPIHTFSDYGTYTIYLTTRSEYGFDSMPHVEIVELINLIGDMNNDDSLDILDIIYIVDILLSNNPIIDDQLFEIDFNNDNVINIIDLVLFVQIILN